MPVALYLIISLFVLLVGPLLEKFHLMYHAVNYTVFCIGSAVPITLHNLAFGICNALLHIVGIVTAVPDRRGDVFVQVYSVCINAIIAWGVLPPHLCAAWLGVLMISVVIFAIVIQFPATGSSVLVFVLVEFIMYAVCIAVALYSASVAPAGITELYLYMVVVSGLGALRCAVVFPPLMWRTLLGVHTLNWPYTCKDQYGPPWPA